MLRKVESFFPLEGLQEEWFTNEAGDLTIVKKQDLDPVYASIKAQREEPVSKELKKAAEIPLVVFEEYLNKRGFSPLLHTDKDKMRLLKDMLNDPDYSKFRIWNGRVGRHK